MRRAADLPRAEARPLTERVSHYFAADPPEQFDAVIHFDRTHAGEPLDNHPGPGRVRGAARDLSQRV